jgi:hypothetical protein
LTGGVGVGSSFSRKAGVWLSLPAPLWPPATRTATSSTSSTISRASKTLFAKRMASCFMVFPYHITQVTAGQMLFLPLRWLLIADSVRILEKILSGFLKIMLAFSAEVC